jgi:murein DD-endopeptidase MepM/ murein hydrolase activator NlpD
VRLDEASTRINLIQDYVPPGASNRPGTRITPRYVTIHNTDNDAAGADARAHGRYQKGADARRRKVSWHFTVDDACAVQSIPENELAWHTGTGAGNATSIGVEICMNAGLDEAAAYDRAALLCAYLGRLHAIAMPDGLRQHHDWSGKNCPRILRARAGGWAAFKAKVGEYAQALRPVAAPALTLRREALELAAGSTRAKAVPEADPVPFAESSVAQRFWPVITRNAAALTVSCETDRNRSLGAPGRKFLANRSGGGRNHVGIDLYANAGDEVIACEDGRIVNFYAFYPRANGEMTYALLVAHNGFVANYGEVTEDSPRAYGWRIGDQVRAGQHIAKVSGTSMLHFESYRTGTRANVRWMVGAQRPAAVLNPTQYLLDTAEHGVRIEIGGQAAPGTATTPAPTTPALLTINRAVPLPGAGEWQRFGNGREFRFTDRGVFTRDLANGTTPWRTGGVPLTCRAIWTATKDSILAMAEKHGVNPALVMMTVATEAGIYRPSNFTGPATYRWEPRVENTDVTPRFLGSYSAGPMQTLATTVRETVRLFRREYGLNYDPAAIAPATRAKPNPAPASHPLYDLAASVELGCAIIRRRWRSTGDNPIFVAAAYNAGGLYSATDNPWGLKVHGDHLDRAAKWYGDACAVLVEEGVL